MWYIIIYFKFLNNNTYYNYKLLFTSTASIFNNYFNYAFFYIIEAFKMLDKKNICHRDVKPANIMMNNG